MSSMSEPSEITGLPEPHAEHLGVVDRRGAQCLQRGEAIRDEPFDFARVVAVCDRS